jgi:DNA-binding NtrC family response regulator
VFIINYNDQSFYNTATCAVQEAIRKKNTESTDIAITEESINFNYHASQLGKDPLLKDLKINGGVKNRAAKLLDVNRTTLVEKLKRFNMADVWID